MALTTREVISKNDALRKYVETGAMHLLFGSGKKSVFVHIASVSMSERCTSRQRRPAVAVSGVISGHGALREDVEAGQLHVFGR